MEQNETQLVTEGQTTMGKNNIIATREGVDIIVKKILKNRQNSFTVAGIMCCAVCDAVIMRNILAEFFSFLIGEFVPHSDGVCVCVCVCVWRGWYWLYSAIKIYLPDSKDHFLSIGALYFACIL